MLNQNIDILCIQETRRQLSDYYVRDSGFLVLFRSATKYTFPKAHRYREGVCFHKITITGAFGD